MIKMHAPEKLSATDAAAAIAGGKLTSEALVAACLERVRQRENEVQAWAYIDPDAALREARARDRQTPRTRLHGIPVAVKDVIDTMMRCWHRARRAKRLELKARAIRFSGSCGRC